MTGLNFKTCLICRYNPTEYSRCCSKAVVIGDGFDATSFRDSNVTSFISKVNTDHRHSRHT